MGRRLGHLAGIPVDELRGVGPKKAEALEVMDPPIRTVLDLVTHYPRRYLDRTQQALARKRTRKKQRRESD